MSVSLVPNHLYDRQLITTSIVFVNPTDLGSFEPSNGSLPVAAIAGGTCGGVVLAVLAVIGWKWWGRQIKKREERELAKRKTMARKESMLNKGRSSRSPTSSRRTSSDSVHKPAINPPSDPVPPVPPLPPLDSISSPRPLKPRATLSEKDVRPVVHGATVPPSPTPASGAGATSASPFAARSRSRKGTGASDGKSYSYRPLRSSPLALAAAVGSRPPRTTELSSLRQHQEKPSEAITATAAPQTPPSSFGQIPRIKASLSSLTGEARRQSKASSSHNSASDQSRHSGSARRWSWWSLINRRNSRQLAVGTGRNRISADTSLYEDWQEEDTSVPVGYAYSGVGDTHAGDVSREPQHQPNNESTRVFHYSDKLERGT